MIILFYTSGILLFPTDINIPVHLKQGL